MSGFGVAGRERPVAIGKTGLDKAGWIGVTGYGCNRLGTARFGRQGVVTQDVTSPGATGRVRVRHGRSGMDGCGRPGESG